MIRTHRALAAAMPRGTVTRVGATSHDADTYDETRDIDWIAVERATNGEYDPALLNDAEKRETALLMARAGMRERAISNRIYVYERRIGEWLAEAGLLPPERICSRDNCGHLMVGLGLCTNHLQRKRNQEKRAREAAQQSEQMEVAA